MAFKNVLILLVISPILLRAITSSAEEMMWIKPGHNLEGRLYGEGTGNCWNALLELKSCSNEIVLFFLNGESNISIDCCRAIHIITRECWPTMISSLGFTSQEGNILRGYCDATTTSTPTAPVQAPFIAPLGIMG